MQNDRPSDRNTPPSYDPHGFERGITTRVMAKRQAEMLRTFDFDEDDEMSAAEFFRRQSVSSSRRTSYAPSSKRASVASNRRGSTVSGSSESRRSSTVSYGSGRTFLKGTAIPNSTARAGMNPMQLQEEDLHGRNERDARDDTLASTAAQGSSYDETRDREAMEQIKRELEKLGREIRIRSRHAENNDIEEREQDPSKLELRVTRRTSRMEPLAVRRPTYEEIRRAIENSKLIKTLVDPDYIRENNIETGRNLNFPEYSFIQGQNRDEMKPIVRKNISSFISKRKKPKKQVTIRFVAETVDTETQTSFVLDEAMIRDIIETRRRAMTS